MDQPSTSYAASRAWPMEPWSHKSLPDMKRYVQELVLQSSSRHRFPYNQIPAQFMFDRLNEAPKLGSRFEHYHRDVRDSLIAKATQWLQAQPGQAGATLYGDKLAEYYLEQLQQHFEPEKKANYRQSYARLAQNNVAPTAYLQEALTYKPYLGISDSEFATNWLVEGRRDGPVQVRLELAGRWDGGTAQHS
ncbi:hypothetical protein GPECTOR_293g790 [Gonium pectorale]|uniref:Uncharacterized protein n=1 Tax=Gonium pectorale TaxID=33097 RepID=A0A150FVZ4_GONPE|nr:hypothetical protein GPECTOR_293g790 [Gonium pectorale]|eukprot:KXZ41757.1 hypothetical protein GPECTOR_293g790 [Gonium pectorale]